MAEQQTFNPPCPLHTPVLFLVFKRPGTTRQVFERIRQAKPPRLYVAADGPREHVDGEDEKCRQVRKIATAVDWPCDVKTLFRKNNLGCKVAVSSAIDWFFENEERGIILEDDCLPCQSFFSFCNELLEKYSHDTRVMVVSGSNFQFGKRRTNYSYYFSNFNHCWGWATWRRAWRCYSKNMELWPEIRNRRYLKDILHHEEMVAYWSRAFEMAYRQEIDTWDYIWTFSCWIRNGLTVLPNVNLVSNLGFGIEATHTKLGPKMANMPSVEMAFPLEHPPFVIRDDEADQRTHRICYRPGWYRRFVDRIRLRQNQYARKLY